MDKSKLTLIDGGKDKKVVPEGDNWLAKEEVGSVFLFRPYGSKRVILNIRQLLKRWDNTTLLGVNLNGEEQDKPPVLEYVDTQLFSNLHEKVETIFVMPQFNAEELLKEQENDGNQVHPERVE